MHAEARVQPSHEVVCVAVRLGGARVGVRVVEFGLVVCGADPGSCPAGDEPFKPVQYRPPQENLRRCVLGSHPSHPSLPSHPPHPAHWWIVRIASLSVLRQYLYRRGRRRHHGTQLERAERGLLAASGGHVPGAAAARHMPQFHDHELCTGAVKPLASRICCACVAHCIHYARITCHACRTCCPCHSLSHTRHLPQVHSCLPFARAALAASAISCRPH